MAELFFWMLARRSTAFDLRGKSPTLSQLACVELDLENNARILESGRCANKNSATNGNVDLRCDGGKNPAWRPLVGSLDGGQIGQSADLMRAIYATDLHAVDCLSHMA
jgi:hypothetical protein